MAIEINAGLLNNSPMPLDARYARFVSGNTVAYSSIYEANASITSAYRSLGLTVLIYKNGVPVEYWYREGINDNNLVEKQTVSITDYSSLSNTPDLSVYALKSTTVNGYPLSSNITITKSDTGLGNADNTSDLAKPVSTATQVALNLKQNLSQKGQAGGYAPVALNGLIPSTFLPSYIDNIIEYPGYSDFPSTGQVSIIYKANDTGVQYRWSGTSYSMVTAGAVQSVNGMTGNVTIVYQAPIVFSTNGSGAATFDGTHLNIPTNSGSGGGGYIPNEDYFILKDTVTNTRYKFQMTDGNLVYNPVTN